MNLQEELKALKERIAELEEQEKQEREFPKKDDDYWFIDERGEVLIESWDVLGSEIDMLEIGNIYKTEEQAEFAVEKLKVEAELRKFSVPFKHGGDNYTFNYNHENGKIVNLYASEGYQDFGALYFESNEELNKAIESVGKDRIKKYIFGVED